MTSDFEQWWAEHQNDFGVTEQMSVTTREVLADFGAVYGVDLTFLTLRRANDVADAFAVTSEFYKNYKKTKKDHFQGKEDLFSI